MATASITFTRPVAQSETLSDRFRLVARQIPNVKPISVPVVNREVKSQPLDLDVRLSVTEEDLESVVSGRKVKETIRELNLSPKFEKTFVTELRRKAKADGLNLSTKEARILANLLVLVGQKFADETG